MTKPLILTIVLSLCLLIIHIEAQDMTEESEIILQVGDPPHANRMSVSASETEPFTILIMGDTNAVFPSAQVAVRNIYTGTTAYTTAAFDGSFEISLTGLPDMPYQINADTRFDQTAMPENLSGIGVIIHNDNSFLGQGIPIAIGGLLSYGAGIWLAEGFVNALTFNHGETISINLDITFLADNLDPSLDYQMRGNLALRRFFDENGNQLSTAIGSGADWSSEFTPTGLPILGRTVPDIVIAEVTSNDITVDAEASMLTFSLNFETQLPQNLQSGIYMPVFMGEVSLNNSQFTDWYANRIFSANGNAPEDTSATNIPLMLRVGTPQMPTVEVDLSNDTDENHALRILGLPLVTPLATAQIASQDLPVIVRDNNLIVPSESITATDGTTTARTSPISGHLSDTLGNQYSFDHPLPPIETPQLLLSPSLLTGTPLVNGQSIALAGSVSPPVLSDIQMRLNINNNANTLLDPIGQSNRFGYFYRGNIQPESGQYRLDWNAQGQFLDETWSDSMTQSGVVTRSDNPAYGVYGLADYTRNTQAWFDTSAYPTDAPDILPFINFPYFSGDVAYIPDSVQAGINPGLSGGDYQYVSVVRPDNILAHFVRDSDATFDARISNDDLFDNPIGIGLEGNLPEDVMWLFGGLVNGENTQGYSTITIVTDDASARVVPPFTEALLLDNGDPVAMFVHPTGIRPGQVLEIGDTFTSVGYVAPTVAADVTTTIVTPSQTISNTTQASQFGYFYQPEHDLTVTETGVYTVYLDATYNGETSIGTLPEPVYGTVLGADNGSYYIFVVERDTPMLSTSRPPVSEVAAGQAFTINLSAPEDWTDVSAYYAVRTPQWILEQGELDTFANQTNYSFNWNNLARLFPNLEFTANEPSDMDEITFSFAFTGTDANGVQQIRGRMFTLRGNTLYTAPE